MVVCDVEVCLVYHCQGVWAVDLGVHGSFEVGCGVFFGPEAEEFEAGAGLGVVYYVEGAAWVVVFDSEGVEVGVGEGEVEEFDGGGFGVRGGVVVDVELALGLGVVEDALVGSLVRLHAGINTRMMSWKRSVSGGRTHGSITAMCSSTLEVHERRYKGKLKMANSP